MRAARRFTHAAWRTPIGLIWTIWPSRSSTRSSSCNTPVSPMRWYSSTVKRRTARDIPILSTLVGGKGKRAACANSRSFARARSARSGLTPCPPLHHVERGNDGRALVSPLPKGEGIKGVRTNESGRTCHPERRRREGPTLEGRCSWVAQPTGCWTLACARTTRSSSAAASRPLIRPTRTSGPFAPGRRFRGWGEQRGLEPLVDVLFVDTSHVYDHTRAEIDAWFPHLSPRAVALFHDTNMKKLFRRRDGTLGLGWNNHRGVVRALEDVLGIRIDERRAFTGAARAWHVTHDPICNGLTILRRTGDDTVS